MEGVVLYVALVRVFIKKQKLYIAAFTIASYGVPTNITTSAIYNYSSGLSGVGF